MDDRDLLDNSRRKALFREMVKNVRNDYQTDINGALARLLEQAFKAGVDVGRREPEFEPTGRGGGRRGPKPAEETIDMLTLPPRAREALHTIAIIAGRSDFNRGEWRDEVSPIVFRKQNMYPLSDKDVWGFVHPAYKRGDTMGMTTLGPLERLGVLAMSPDDRYLILTLRGLRLIEEGSVSTSVPAEPLWQIVPKPPQDDPETPRP